MKICQYLSLHFKVISSRFQIKTTFHFWDMRMWDMWKVCLQTLRNNRICKKLPYFLRNLQTSRPNNSRILRIKNAKYSGYCFYMNSNIWGDFQICISVPLSNFMQFWRISCIIQILYSFENTTTLPRCLKSSFLNLVKSSADKPYIHHLQPENFPSLGKQTIVTAIATLQKRWKRLFVSASNHLQQRYSNDSNDE